MKIPSTFLKKNLCSASFKMKLLKNAFFCVKDAHREKAPSNETQALTKSINMGIWVVGTTNQLSIRGS